MNGLLITVLITMRERLASWQQFRASYIEFQTFMQGQNPSVAIRQVMLEAMTLIAYRDDPGFLLTSESNEHFPGKDRLFCPLSTGMKREMITVVDQDAFDRWLSEDRRARRLSREPAGSSRETDNERPQ
jgi:hypothetical protein